MPVAAIFGLVGGYLVYQSFAYTPLLAGSDGEFVALSPSRIMDTRNGNGGYSAPIPANGTYSLQVTDRGGVPAVAGVKAVVLSVAAVSPSANGFMTVWPSGVARPTVSNINYVTGQTIANQVTVPVGPDGKIQFFSNVSTHIIVDISGYYSSENGIPGARYNALNPARMLDTRNGLGGYTAPLATNGVYDVQITGAGGVPVSDVSAVVINVVAINPTSNGFTTVWPAGATRPDSSSLNYVSGKTIAKLVTVPVGANGKVSIFNSGSATNYIVDVAGYYSNDITPDTIKTQAGRFVSVKPARIMDTRSTGGALQANVTKRLYVGREGVPSTNVKAVVLNITAVNPLANGFLTAWPFGISKPNASNINFVKGQSTANQAIVLVGSNGEIQLNSSVSTNVLVDVAGYFIDYEDQYINTSKYIYFGDSISTERVIPQNQLSFEMDVKSSQIDRSRFYVAVKSTDGYSHRHHSFSVEVYKNGTDKLEVRCGISDSSLCKPLSAESTDTSGYDYYRSLGLIRFDYELSTGVHKLNYEIALDAPNQPGRWLTTSIKNPNGTITKLVTEFIGSSALGGYMAMGAGVSTYDCNSTDELDINLGNIVIDNSTPTGFWYSNAIFNPPPTNCAGYSQTTTFSDAISPYPSLLRLRLGIPKGSRDINPPVIEQATFNSEQYNLSVRVIDNVSVDMFRVTAVAQPDQYQFSRENIYSDSFEGTFSLDPLQLPTGDNAVLIQAYDNSGNLTEKIITVTTP